MSNVYDFDVKDRFGNSAIIKGVRFTNNAEGTRMYIDAGWY